MATDEKNSLSASIPFVNNGEPFDLPLIRVKDIREMQKNRVKTTDPYLREMDASITLAHIILQRVDSKVTREQIEDWDYAEFLKFIKQIWDKNAENFRGILQTLPQVDVNLQKKND